MSASAEFVQLWQPGIAGIELFRANLVRHVFDKHFHDTYTIGMNDGGQGCFLHEGTTHYAQPGQFNLINPGDVHTGQVASEAGWRFRNLYISVPLVQQVLSQMEWDGPPQPGLSQAIVRDGPLLAMFHQLFQALSLPTSPLAQQSLLLEALAGLFWRYGSTYRPLPDPKPETRAVAIARSYLEAHYAEPIAIDALANLVNLSPYYLILSFRQQVGLPPHRYQRQWQLLQAKRSLCTPCSLSDVAIAHGFYDQSHLNRAFKRAFGVTPGQYRQGAGVMGLQ